MKQKEEAKKKNKSRGKEFFVRMMAGILAILMLAGVASTLIFYLIKY